MSKVQNQPAKKSQVVEKGVQALLALKKKKLQKVESAYGMDDYTLYRIGDFETIQERGDIFAGYLLGWKLTPKRGIPLFYFITEHGEIMKTFGNGNLTAALTKQLENGHVLCKTTIIHLGKVMLDVEIDGVMTPTMVNQWDVSFDRNDKTDFKIDQELNVSGEIA